MAGRAICKETIKKNTINEMKKNGVFKPEYNTCIDVYSELVEQYYRLTKKYKDSEYKFEEHTADGGKKKAPIVATLESLRKDILLYSDRLCLNPKANMPSEKKGKEKEATSSELAKALASIET